MVDMQRVSANEDIKRVLNILEQDGCLVIEDLLDQDLIRQLKAELHPHFAKAPNCHGDFYGYVTKRLSGLITKSVECQGMSIHPRILEVMDAFLLRGCKEYQLNLTQAIQIGAGEPEQIIHTDDAMFPFVHPGQEAMINCMWAVDDFTHENGATCVVPGSHKWEAGRQPAPDEIIKGVMKAGSVLIYFGSLWHSGGANRSTQSRTGIVISYCLGWLRQAENHYLSVPRELAATFPERLQRLLGYFVHEPNLGCVEGQNPQRLLTGELVINGNFEEFLPIEVLPLLAEHRKSLSQGI